MATMKHRKSVAKITRARISKVLKSKNPFLRAEVFRNLYELEKMAGGKSGGFAQNASKYNSQIMTNGVLARMHATDIEYYKYSCETLTERVARACEKYTTKGLTEEIPVELSQYFEKMLDIFDEVLNDESVLLTQGYVMYLGINAEEIAV